MLRFQYGQNRVLGAGLFLLGIAVAPLSWAIPEQAVVVAPAAPEILPGDVPAAEKEADTAATEMKAGAATDGSADTVTTPTAAEGTQGVAASSLPAKKNPDPLEGMNRFFYRFNDVLDRALLKPVAKGYRKVTPRVVRTGITNFFQNLKSPIVVLNDLLQGKIVQAGSDTVRFVVNTTVGVAGFVDVAQHVKLPAHSEDFGQTLGVWGVPSGPYLVLPFFGPSSLRDAGGRAVDTVSNPRNYYLDFWPNVALTAADTVNFRAGLLDVEDIIQGDRYLFIRDLYLQRREYEVKDGRVVSDPFLDDVDEGDGAAVTAPAQPLVARYVEPVPGAEGVALMVRLLAESTLETQAVAAF
jgi:phospholipid-binding lipoprotein MlaA